MLLFRTALLSFYARNSSLKVPLPLILRTRWSQAFSKLGTHSFSLRPTGLSQVSKLLHHVVPSTLNYSGSSPGISLQIGFQHSNILVIFPLVWLIFKKKLKNWHRADYRRKCLSWLECQSGYESSWWGRHSSRSVRPSWAAGTRLITSVCKQEAETHTHTHKKWGQGFKSQGHP